VIICLVGERTHTWVGWLLVSPPRKQTYLPVLPLSSSEAMGHSPLSNWIPVLIRCSWQPTLYSVAFATALKVNTQWTKSNSTAAFTPVHRLGRNKIFHWCWARELVCMPRWAKVRLDFSCFNIRIDYCCCYSPPLKPFSVCS